MAAVRNFKMSKREFLDSKRQIDGNDPLDYLRSENERRENERKKIEKQREEERMRKEQDEKNRKMAEEEMARKRHAASNKNFHYMFLD